MSAGRGENGEKGDWFPVNVKDGELAGKGDCDGDLYGPKEEEPDWEEIGLDGAPRDKGEPAG